MIGSGELIGLSLEDSEILYDSSGEDGERVSRWKKSILVKMTDKTIVTDTAKNHDFIMFLRNERDVF